MRRPAMTKAQRQHAREQRALLRLRRAAVRYSVASDDAEADLALPFADLTAACDAYADVLTARERRRFLK